MLSEKSIPGPKYSDPMIRVKVLVPFFMLGKVCEIGSVVTMLSSEARAAAETIIPPRVEII